MGTDLISEEIKTYRFLSKNFKKSYFTWAKIFGIKITQKRDEKDNHYEAHGNVNVSALTHVRPFFLKVVPNIVFLSGDKALIQIMFDVLKCSIYFRSTKSTFYIRR